MYMQVYQVQLPETEISQIYEICLIRHFQPEFASKRGRLLLISFELVQIGGFSYLAPKHQPSSLPFIFFAILTSRSIGIS